MILICQLGFKMTLSMLLKWPGMLLISLFTPFMFSCENLNGKKYLTVSKKWTIINFLVSILFNLSGRCFFHFFWIASKFNDANIDNIIYASIIYKRYMKDFGIPALLLTLIVCLPLYLLSIICYTILLKCKVNGKHLYKRSAMNIEDWNDIIDPDNFQDGTDLELGALLKTRKAVSDPSTLNFSHRIVCIPKSFEA